jgi:hypothetical protein
MEAILSEFDYFNPTVLQSSIIAEFDEAISTVNTIAPTGNALSPFEFNIPGTSDLYRDLNNSYIVLKVKVTNADGTNLANDAVIAPVNLYLHSLFENVSLMLGGKEITEKDSLYPYRAYMETLLTYEDDVLKTRAVTEGWQKDEATRMNNITLTAVDGQPVPNAAFVERRKLIAESRVCTLIGRLHLDLFHQNLDIPPGCAMNIKLKPSKLAFTFMGGNALAAAKILVLDAKLYIRSKRVCPELILAHKKMLQTSNIRIPINRVTVSRYGISDGFSKSSIALNFPAKLPKRLIIGFVTNAASDGSLATNPFNFEPFGLTSIEVKVNGTPVPANGLELDYTAGDYQQAYLNTLASLGLDNSNRCINLTPKDFAGGFALYGFKLAPGPIDGTVFTAANSVGSVVVDVKFSAGLAAATDMIVYAETPAIIEIDKLSAVTIV